MGDKSQTQHAGLSSEIAAFEKRVGKKQSGTGSPAPESDDDEDGGLTQESREKLKSKMLVDQLYQKYCLIFGTSFRSEELRKCQELVTSIESGKAVDPKDKRLLELAKKQRSMLQKLDSYKDS